MEYAVEIGSGALMYVPSFIKTGSGIHKTMVCGGGVNSQTHRRHNDPTSHVQFF
jgi:hypothetical protein